MPEGFSTDATRPPGPPRPPATPWPASARTPGEEAIAGIDRIHGILGELRSLLDDSTRHVGIARVALAAEPGATARPSAKQADENLAEAASGLERMAEIVHGAMQSAAIPLGSPTLHNARPATLGEAITHAIDVLTPMAQRHNTSLEMNVPSTAEATPAGAMYTVILNAIQNAIESIARRAAKEPPQSGENRDPLRGTVRVEVRHQPAPGGTSHGRDGRAWLALDITDTGEGPPQREDARARCFDLGVTTKPKGAGVGLSVARSVVTGMGGTIQLLPRDDAPGGARLLIHFPVAATRRSAA